MGGATSRYEHPGVITQTSSSPLPDSFAKSRSMPREFIINPSGLYTTSLGFSRHVFGFRLKGVQICTSFKKLTTT